MYDNEQYRIYSVKTVLFRKDIGESKINPVMDVPGDIHEIIGVKIVRNCVE